jgi:hypothetical protein
MWSSSLLGVALLVVVLAGCTPPAAKAIEVCPVRAGQPLRYADVFDGPVTDMATLVPETTNERSGYWPLGYVYEAGRSVVIRCKYADKTVEDVKLTQRVERCDYALDASETLKITCK